MQYMNDSVLRLKSILDVLDQALAGEFPYAEPKMALIALRICIVDNLNDLNTLETLSEESQRITCERADQVSKDISFLIGFLIRSTNVRNAFEWIWPFQEMCDKLFSHNPKKVVLSSEWNFIPFITTVAPYSNIPALSDFVFIGLPASESQNPLIIPAAAHEVGHALWQTIFNEEIETSIKIAIENEIKKKGIPIDVDRDQAHYDVHKQIQEIFCDLIGLGLFGTGYLHTFHYFCPTAGKRIGSNLVRTPEYPSNNTRANQMIEFCKDIDCTPPMNYLERYDDPYISGVFERENYILFVDLVASDLFLSVRKHVKSLLEKQNLLRGDRRDQVSLILSAFADDQPYHEPESIADIVEAGWIAYLGRNKFSDKFHDLSNLVLKTIEIYEFNQRGQGMGS